MVLSPMQREYVTKVEFKEFTENVDLRFDEIDKRFVEQKAYTEDGFEKVFKQIDAVESNLGRKIDAVAVDVSWLKMAVTKLLKKARI